MIKFDERPGAQPASFNEEYTQAAQLVRGHAEWQAAMKRRGIEDVDQVYLHFWSGGDASIEGVPESTRVMRVLSFFAGAQPNPYVRPIEGVVVALDMNRLAVIEVRDTGNVPISPTKRATLNRYSASWAYTSKRALCCGSGWAP